jgi:hypothetical protein
MLVERKHYIRGYTGATMSAVGVSTAIGINGTMEDGAEIEPPSNVFPVCGPNLRNEWVVEQIEPDTMNNLFVVWCLVTTTLEPGDEGYTPELVRTPPVIPAQRVTATLEVLTHQKTEMGDLQDWLAARLRDCPLGYLTLKDMHEEATPTRWNTLTRDDDPPPEDSGEPSE